MKNHVNIEALDSDCVRESLFGKRSRISILCRICALATMNNSIHCVYFLIVIDLFMAHVML